MSTITTRAGKGTPLTNTELDANFTNLNTDKLELGGTYSGGTANGVAYLNGSKVLTTGSALTFDGTNLINTGGYYLKTAGTKIGWDVSGVYFNWIESGGTTGADYLRFGIASVERMRLTSTGLGIGTSSPRSALNVVGDITLGATPGATVAGTSYSIIGNNALSGSAAGGNLTVGAGGGSGVAANGSLYLRAGQTMSPLSATTGGNVIIESGKPSDGQATGYIAFNRYAGIPSAAVESMRLDSSGNVGIGTSSPNYLLSVQANSVQMGMSPQSGIGYLGNYSNAPIGFVVNNAEKMRLDAAGNLGLGVTPSAWGSNYRSLDIKSESVYSYAGTYGGLVGL